jgi:hypothetical protein
LKGGVRAMKKIAAIFTMVLILFSSTIFSFGAEDPNVVLVNPASYSTVYSNNILISVKITEPKRIKVSFYEEKQMVNGTPVAVNLSSLNAASVSSGSFNDSFVTSSGVFVTTKNLSFYTQKVENLKPGLYKIHIDTLDSSDRVLYSTDSYVIVKEKTNTSEEKILDSEQSGTMQFLQNLLKTIFGE